MTSVTAMKGAVGFVSLAEAQGDVEDEPCAAFGGPGSWPDCRVRVQGGAGVAEHIVRGHVVADHVGGQSLLLGR